ncbi:MAG: SCO family protein [Bryobacteraceae bacterium]
MNLGASAAALILALAASPAVRAEGSLPKELEQVGIDQKLNQQLPLDLVFRDESGREVKLGDYFGRRKPIVLSLVYYKCPMLCTMVLNGMLRSMRAVSFNAGEEYEVVTVSIDPREKPSLAAASKRTYMKRYRRDGAEKGWHFLTGDEESISKLAEAVGFRYTFDPETNQFAHASGIMVATPKGRLSRYLYGVEYAPRDLRLGLIEASEEKIGSPVDQLLLYCFHYDPAVGKYGLIIQNVIRLGGMLTVAGLVTLLLVLNRQSRHRKADYA